MWIFIMMVPIIFLVHHNKYSPMSPLSQKTRHQSYLCLLFSNWPILEHNEQDFPHLQEVYFNFKNMSKFFWHVCMHCHMQCHYTSCPLVWTVLHHSLLCHHHDITCRDRHIKTIQSPENSNKMSYSMIISWTSTSSEISEKDKINNNPRTAWLAASIGLPSYYSCPIYSLYRKCEWQ